MAKENPSLHQSVHGVLIQTVIVYNLDVTAEFRKHVKWMTHEAVS